LYPTVCEMAGIAIPKKVQGRSLADILNGQQHNVHPFSVGYFRKVRLDRMRRSLNQWFHDQGDPQFLQ